MKAKKTKTAGRSSSRRSHGTGTTISVRNGIYDGLSEAQLRSARKFEGVYMWMLTCFMRNGMPLSRLP